MGWGKAVSRRSFINGSEYMRDPADGAGSLEAPSGDPSQDQQRCGADRHQDEVGERVAAEVREKAAQGGAYSVTGGPGDVVDGEGHGLVEAGLLRAAREEGRPGHERGVEGAAGEHDEAGDQPRVRRPREHDEYPGREEEARQDGRPVTALVRPPPEVGMDHGLEAGADEKDRADGGSAPAGRSEVERDEDRERG